MRSILTAAALTALALAISVLGSTGTLYAQGMAAMSLDMDPSGSTATSLGSRQNCVEALPGDTLTVDVTAEDVPAETAMIAYGYTILFDTPGIAITDQEPLMIASNPGSALLNATGPFPSFEGTLSVSVADLAVETTASESGSGVLDRLTIEVATDASPRVYVLSIAAAGHIDIQNNPYPPSLTYDGRIAVGVSCAATTPIPPHTAAPTSSPSPGESIGPTAALTPTSAATGSEATPGSPTPASTSTGNSPTPAPGTPTPSPTETDDGGSGDGGVSAIVVVAIVVACLVAAAAIAWVLTHRSNAG